MTAFFLFQNLGVTDAAAFEEYKRLVPATVDAHGGRYLVVAGRVETIEGDAALPAPVLIEFPSVEAARGWYDSPEYRPLKEMRWAALRATGHLVEGV